MNFRNLLPKLKLSKLEVVIASLIAFTIGIGFIINLVAKNDSTANKKSSNRTKSSTEAKSDKIAYSIVSLDADTYALNTAEDSYDKGLEYAIQGKFLKAKEEFEKDLKTDPFYSSAEFSLKTIRDVIEQKIKREIVIHLFKGIFYSYKDQYDNAISDYNKAIDMDPMYAAAYNNRGNTYDYKGEYDKAISDYNKAIAQSPEARCRAIARREYPSDIQMQQFTYNQQIAAYRYMISVWEDDVKQLALREYPEDFAMQKFTYDQQSAAKRYMTTVADGQVKQIALREYPYDFAMQKFTYDQQLSAKQYMAAMPNTSAKQQAIREYPYDYAMQQFTYDQARQGR